MSINKILEKILDLLYPGRCPVCDRILAYRETLVCPDCIGKLTYIKEPKCMKCGKQMMDDEAEYCAGCRDKRQYFRKGFSVFLYNDAMRKSIYRFKYANRREYSRFYAEAVCRHLGKEIREFCADAIIPVPLHPKRFRKRGYNQAGLIAGEIGRRMGIPVREEILIRERNTKALKLMTLTERENNLKKAFKMVKNDVKLNTVIIVDDILTTGSTINEVSRVLRENGIKNVYFVALASGADV